jgi:hypothetical protein
VKKKVFYVILIAFVVWETFTFAEGTPPEMTSGIYDTSKPAATAVITEEAVWEQLRDVKDQQFVTICGFTEALSVVDMGLIYGVTVENNNVRVVLTTYHSGFLNVQLIAAVKNLYIICMSSLKQIQRSYPRTV